MNCADLMSSIAQTGGSIRRLRSFDKIHQGKPHLNRLPSPQRNFLSEIASLPKFLLRASKCLLYTMPGRVPSTLSKQQNLKETEDEASF
jgi:hypothetical protein